MIDQKFYSGTGSRLKEEQDFVRMLVVGVLLFVKEVVSSPSFALSELRNELRELPGVGTNEARTRQTRQRPELSEFRRHDHKGKQETSLATARALYE